MQVPQNLMDLYRHKAGDCGPERARTHCSWAVAEELAFSPELSMYPLCVSGFSLLCTVGKLIYSPSKKSSHMKKALPCFRSLDTKRTYSEMDSLLEISSHCHRC